MEVIEKIKLINISIVFNLLAFKAFKDRLNKKFLFLFFENLSVFYELIMNEI
jgi:hypothetical protein